MCPGAGWLLAGATEVNHICPICLPVSSTQTLAHFPGGDRGKKGKCNYISIFSDPCFVKSSNIPMSKASHVAESRIKMAREVGSPQITGQRVTIQEGGRIGVTFVIGHIYLRPQLMCRLSRRVFVTS